MGGILFYLLVCWFVYLSVGLSVSLSCLPICLLARLFVLRSPSPTLTHPHPPTALQDVCEAMGPTVFIPTTHTEAAYLQRYLQTYNALSYPYPLSLLFILSVFIFVLSAKVRHALSYPPSIPHSPPYAPRK